MQIAVFCCTYQNRTINFAHFSPPPVEFGLIDRVLMCHVCVKEYAAVCADQAIIMSGVKTSIKSAMVSS